MNILEKEYRDIVDEHIENLEYDLETTSYLENFERDMRMGCYSEMIKQSNTQKMQLILENYISANPDNWKKWKSLINKKQEAALNLKKTETLLEYYRSIVSVKNG